MKESNGQSLTIELKHRGERLELRRIKTINGAEELRMTGSLLAHRQGPPPHIHFEEDEHAEVVSGTASVLVGGKRLVLNVGEPVYFPKGSVHSWWNDGDEELVLRGVVTPVIDLDRYLQAVFEVLDAGPPNRPPIFYLAHVLYRHRRTQLTPFIPRAVQRVPFPSLCC
jgi:quercetin dioxygenase-like cupin family protein